VERFEGRTAVVTGAGSGIGRGLALGFGDVGMKVAVIDIDEDAAAAVAGELEARGAEALSLASDVTSAESLAAAAKEVAARFGGTQLLCANAGVMLSLGPLTEKSESDWEYVFSVNLFGVVKTVTAFLPQLRAAGEAHIVNTASLGGIAAVPKIPIGVYVASKYACVGYSECLRAELAPENIGVSVLCPGMVASDLYRTSMSHRPGRFGGPQELAPPMPADTAGQVEQAGVPPGAMRAEEVGPIVVQAVRENRLHIFTHAEAGRLAEKRFEAIRADVEATARGGA